MKAIRIHSFGGPDQVRIEDVPKPAIGQDEALVRVKAAAVNPVDWMLRERIYVPEGSGRLPLTLGQDFAGVIEQVGTGERRRFEVGDEVFGEAWGAFAEYVVVPIKDLVRKPRGLDFKTAAAIPMPALTAWQVVIDTAKARPGMTFLIHGASGGVGSFAAQFAAWKGASVIVTAGPDSIEFLKSFGFEQVIDYRHKRFEEKVKNIDVVVDPIGGETQSRSWQVLKNGGQLINLIGEIDEESARRVGARTVGFEMRYDTAELAEIGQLVEQGLIKPHISKVFPLDQARKALDLNQSNHSHGKIILEVA